MENAQSPDQLTESVGQLSLSGKVNVEVDISQRLEASKRIEGAYKRLAQHFDAAPENIRSWAMNPFHGPSSALDILKKYPETVGLDRGVTEDVQVWYRKCLDTLSTLQEGMERLDAVLVSLSPVSVDVLCPTDPRLPAVIWGSFGVLMFLANPEDAETITFEQRGLFVKSHLMRVFHDIFEGMNFSSALHWMPDCHFISSHAADALSGMYETLAHLLGTLIEAQLRVLAAADEEELERLNEALLAYPEWIEDQVSTLQRSGEELRDALAKEESWRDGELKSALEEAEKLANDGSLDEACQLLERKTKDVSDAPNPPPGVDARQLEFLVRTQLLRLYQKAENQANVVSQVARLHALAREILGRNSQATVIKSQMYAMSITEFDLANTTARDIYLASMDGAKHAYGHDSEITGMALSLLGRTDAAVGDTDAALTHFQEALSILENHLSEETSTAFDNTTERVLDILRARGQHAEVITLAKRISAASEAKLGPTHILTCKHLVNTGFAAIAGGDITSAEEPLKRAAERLEATVGLEHLETQRALGNLMSVYNGQRRYDDSIRVGRRLLAVRERTLGPHAWSTLMTMAKLGAALSWFGAADEARGLLTEARRRLEADPDSEAARGEIADLVAQTLQGLEEDADADAALVRAEERVAGIDLADGALLHSSDIGAVTNLIYMYSARANPEAAYHLVKQAGKTVMVVNGKSLRWSFDEALDDILQKMPTCTDEFVETCREALRGYEIDRPGRPVTPTHTKRELSLGIALLRAGNEDEGVETIRKGMERSRQLEKDGRAYYRRGFSSLFKHYMQEALSGDDIDLSSKTPEFWEKVVRLMEPERGGSLD